MLGLLWFNVEERIQRLRDIGILRWICHFRPTHPLWEGPEDTSFTNRVRNKSVRAALEFLKNSVLILLVRPEFTVATAFFNWETEMQW